jgi:hypothetical protein
VTRWQRYWFADGGRLALAIVRIAVAASVLASLIRLAKVPQLVAADDLYRPVGIWMLFGSSPPPPLVIDLLWVVAWGATACMLVGFATRAATAASFVSAVALAAISHSHTAHWSHLYNVVFLAQLALLGARAGDTLSADALIRRLRGLPALNLPRAYQWSLRLVQLAVALMFVGAVFHKLAHGHFTLRWAFSDNLRHHLMVKYDLAGLERPPLVDWLLADVWRYRTAAVLNLVNQLLPLLAIVFPTRPLVRLVAGLAFVAEVVGLGLVVDLWNLHWLPLAAVFVDWDRLIARFRPPRGESIADAAGNSATLVDGRPPRGPRIFIVAFVIYDVLTSFIPTLDQRLNTYPFSGFPMFANIRLREPFDEHMPYSLVGDRFDITADRPPTAWEQTFTDHHYRGTHAIRDPARLRAQLERIRTQSKARFGLDIRALRHHVAIFEAPAYPAPARFERHAIAITAELDGDRFRTLAGSTLTPTTLELRPQNVDLATVRLVYYADARPEPHELPATRTGNTFTFAAPLKGKQIYVVALVDGVPWLAASRR